MGPLASVRGPSPTAGESVRAGLLLPVCERALLVPKRLGWRGPLREQCGPAFFHLFRVCDPGRIAVPCRAGRHAISRIRQLAVEFLEEETHGAIERVGIVARDVVTRIDLHEPDAPIRRHHARDGSRGEHV